MLYVFTALIQGLAHTHIKTKIYIVMRFVELRYNDNIITKQEKIHSILEKEEMDWLIDSELENVIIEIKNHTLLFHKGTFYSGDIHYCIWIDGDFKGGVFENGIILGGNFTNGKIKSAVRKGGTISV